MSKPFDMKPLLLLASIVRSDMIGSAVTCELCWWIFGNGMVFSFVPLHVVVDQLASDTICTNAAFFRCSWS